MDQVKLDDTFLPPLGYGTVHVPIAAAAELLLHFRSFWSDYQSGNSSLGDPNWKESDEVYLITEKSSALNPDQYIDLVLKNVGNDFTLVFKKIRDRDATNAFLVKHFTVSDTSSLNLIPQITRKLEVMFQKNPKVKKHYSAAVVFDANRSVLLCKRSPTKKIAPNMWHLPGGTIELDENPIETIQRELEEELGLKSISVLPTSVVFSYEINNSIHQTHVFRVDVSNKPIIMNAENSEFAFVPRDQIKNYIEPHLLADNMRAVNVAEAMY
jgi:8-oxo-dGTP pyrophosphatase MutT (NUDIX family)